MNVVLFLSIIISSVSGFIISSMAENEYGHSYLSIKDMFLLLKHSINNKIIKNLILFFMMIISTIIGIVSCFFKIKCNTGQVTANVVVLAKSLLYVRKYSAFPS